MPVVGGTVYLAGTSVGLFATTELNGTATVWYQQGAATIGNAIVDMVDYRQTDGLVVVATHSRGMFSGHITQIADINSVGQLYTAASIPSFTTYPNPFSGQTTISYDLPQNNYVSLKVYDMTGRLVRILADGQQAAGNKQVTLTDTGLAPGIYLCTLQTGDKKATRQIVMQ